MARCRTVAALGRHPRIRTWLMKLLSSRDGRDVPRRRRHPVAAGFPWIEHWFEKSQKRRGLSGIEAFLAASCRFSPTRRWRRSGRIVVAVVRCAQSVAGKRSSPRANH